MTAHSNAAILKAYADNTELVIFILDSNSKWIRTNPKALMDYPDDEFFACLPQHEKPCLHWLNDGDIEFQSAPDWFVYSAEYNERYVWSLAIVFMDKAYCLRPKARKEKRWIALNSFGDVMPVHCKDLESAKQLVQYKDVGINGEIQYIEIEVEV